MLYEPFSNIDGGLKGKSAIKPFLEIAMMANEDMQHEIDLKNQELATTRTTTTKTKIKLQH